MNKFRKILIGAVAAAGISCLGGAAACAGAPEYYQLTFEGKGLDYVYYGALSEKDGDGNIFINGNKVKAGVEVQFGISVGVNTVGTPRIVLNGGETLTPDSDGIYSFVMSEDSKISVEGIGMLYNLTLGKFERTFDSASNDYVNEERWVTYLDENDNALPDEVKVEGGKPFKFKIKPSPYYEGDFTVRLGTEVLIAENGVYTVEGLSGDGIVSVAGLNVGNPFPNREGCGDGSAENPFKLSTPADLYYMAVLINSSMSGFYYNGLHYELAADIDLQGEKLFVIGDGSSNTAAFLGTFDGKGHTISNFRIEDEVVDQSSFATAYLPYVGLFGQASATEAAPCVIKNLTLKDYTLSVHPARVADSAENPIFAAGSIAGYAMGAEITNCHIEGGKIVSAGSYQKTQFIGGMVGVLQSVNVTSNGEPVIFDTYINGCSANLDLEGTGTPFTAGGLVGYLLSVDENAIAYVINSATAGSVRGARQTGGVVGTMSRYSAVTACYSAAEIVARNDIPGANVQYAHAYAGGIVGYAEDDSVIAYCCSANEYYSAHSSTPANGATTFEHAESIVGGKAVAGTTAANSCAPVLFRNATYENNNTFTQLGWSASEWNLTGKTPKPAVTENAKEVNLSVCKNTDTVDGFVGERLPVAGWFAKNLMEKYLDEPAGNGRSWGYYFDKELTQRVPAGFVPLCDETLYVGFADYSEVVGRYYISPLANSRNGYVELTADGRALVRNGGLHYEGTYEYDGENITLVDSCFTALVYPLSQIDGVHYAVKGSVEDGILHLEGKAYSDTDAPDLIIDARLVTDDFYGKYTDEHGATFTFNEDGSGIGVDARGTKSFRYTVDGNFIEIAADGEDDWSATIEGGVIKTVNGNNVTRTDKFAGAWKKSRNSEIGFEFDGKSADGPGMVKITGKTSGSTTYTVTASGASFSLNGADYAAEFVDGYLEINGERYYRDDGFTGNWYMLIQRNLSVDERVDLTFEGLNSEGYGYAVLEYSGKRVSTVTAQYDVTVSGGATAVKLYVDDVTYAELNYNPTAGRISGTFWSVNAETYYANAQFCAYDNFKGIWVSDDESVNTLTFNGKTASDAAEVVLVDSNNVTRRGVYTVSATNPAEGEMTVNGKTYTLSFDEYTGTVQFTEKDGGAASHTLARRDGWRGVTLYDGDDNAYVFDGKGNLAQGGTVTVGAQTYSYEVGGDGLISSINDIAVGGYTVAGISWNGLTLSFKTGFAGEWYVSGTLKKLTVSEVGANFKASVSYDGGEAVEFAYSAADKTLTYVSEVNGVRTSTVLKLAGGSELSMTSGSDSYYCVKEGRQDSYLGKFEAQDGSSYTFDGLGSCTYGTGKVTFKSANGRETEYDYSVNEFGAAYVVTGKGELFVPVSGGKYGKNGGAKYDFVLPDALYQDRVFVTTTQNEGRFAFDGVGGLCKEKQDGSFVKVYDYEINESGTLALTDGSGNKYEGTFVTTGETELIVRPVVD